ncbi:hypothetical protein B0H17DRAFT_1130915 [Mycena rosella]|uniref:Uncharacterized protein n=1 Tax=Mycena rosella TaxID=1033263 RepID=A0AAD7GLG2_MYCRO|nr:hypothetical protein B0H17DRAFT_1130915 [Mycena rosella]
MLPFWEGNYQTESSSWVSTPLEQDFKPIAQSTMVSFLVLPFVMVRKGMKYMTSEVSTAELALALALMVRLSQGFHEKKTSQFFPLPNLDDVITEVFKKPMSVVSSMTNASGSLTASSGNIGEALGKKRICMAMDEPDQAGAPSLSGMNNKAIDLDAMAVDTAAQAQGSICNP